MNDSNNTFGARVAAFGWDRNRARRLFWVHFPLFIFHVPLSLAIIGLPGAFLFGYFALRSFRRWRHSGPVFEIHEHGFVDRRRGYAVRHPFDALADYALIDRVLRFPFPFSFIELHGVALTAKLRGRHFFVNEHLQDIRHCIALLQAGIVRQRLPVVRAALAEGRTLRFGSFRMNASGLHLGKRTLGWHEFAGLHSGVWRAGRRTEPALRILDASGQQWDVAVRAGLTDPALFVLLCEERKPLPDAAVLETFCGLSFVDLSQPQ